MSGSLLKKATFALFAINGVVNLYLSNTPAAFNAFAACWLVFASTLKPITATP
jgi:hypothetical protein